MNKSFSWIVAGVGVGLATYLLLRQSGTQYASDTGYAGVDDAADRTSMWGNEQRIAGTGTNVIGKVKEGLGRVAGNDDLAGEGMADQAVGAVRDAAGSVANAAGKTLKDLNF